MPASLQSVCSRGEFARRLTCGLAGAVALILGLATPLLSDAQGARPIEVGAVSTLCGGFTFLASSLAAKARFDAVNAAGGVRGRRIEHTSLEDQADPAGARPAVAGERWLPRDHLRRA